MGWASFIEQTRASGSFGVRDRRPTVGFMSEFRCTYPKVQVVYFEWANARLVAPCTERVNACVFTWHALRFCSRW